MERRHAWVIFSFLGLVQFEEEYETYLPYKHLSGRGGNAKMEDKHRSLMLIVELILKAMDKITFPPS